MIEPRVRRLEGAYILYDASRGEEPETAWFEPAVLGARGRVQARLRGRGTAWVVRIGGTACVLRHYRRGGVLAPLTGDGYLWTGLARSRPWREWHLLARLAALGLAVPRPVAARVVRRGLRYRADLLTEYLPGALSLAARLARGPLEAGTWAAVGACIARFHAAGVDHADLNAHNVLLAPAGVHLVDLDRGRIRAPGAWTEANLARLHRSLRKLAAQDPGFAFDEGAWSALLAGYRAGSTPQSARASR
ncbi:3-deoxy-D-manno-octulosonic acid kinase [Inmirania thermothiophila]|uniref:3-deoxy-D-manno-octulosonic acid kinase n=1 Tax=Inmirania thermothiophila TaxID=1750597 RepID=A0A3N1Y8A1_9GAMM|nr:3-deoxy-D-manno-octulosonic acid kinase [Inmirania thermothiophila]ROR34751.1 3-deoxy-D-manno-octulosonic acid kinase [Inmirania thermothiophila]